MSFGQPRALVAPDGDEAGDDHGPSIARGTDRRLETGAPIGAGDSPAMSEAYHDADDRPVPSRRPRPDRRHRRSWPPTSRAPRSSPTTRPPTAPAWSPSPSTSSTAATTTASGRPRGRSPGRTPTPFSEVARRRDAWILVGSTAETSADPRRPYNTSTLIAPGRLDRGDVPQDPPVRRRGR